MARLRVQEAAKARNIMSMARLQDAVNKRLDNPVAMGTIRRYWYATRDGKASGDPIAQVDIHLLGTIAGALGVRVSDLLNEGELGQNKARA